MTTRPQIVHNPTRIVDLLSFIEQQNPGLNSGWFHDFFFRPVRTDADRIELRNYATTTASPLFYTKTCLPPKLVTDPDETLNVNEFSFPVMKWETKINCTDVIGHRVDMMGGKISRKKAFNDASRFKLKHSLESLRSRHILEAIHVLKQGGYVLNSSDNENLGTLDFGREPSLSNISLVGTPNEWSEICSRPLNSIEVVIQEMARLRGIQGTVDIVMSALAWDWFQNHSEFEGMSFNSDSRVSQTKSQEPFFEYDDVHFLGSVQGGRIRFWRSDATYVELDGSTPDILEPGEILIASRNAFRGSKLIRTVTSDGAESLPSGMNFFFYDDLEKEYNPKCRTYTPWFEEYHLMIPGNVNAACVMQVVDPSKTNVCTECASCP